MKNLKHVFLTAFSFLMLSFAYVNAAPSLELTAESCGGYVIVYNNSDCLQTVYCHEISTDNYTYNMGTVSPGHSVTVYPTASQARVYSETHSGWESSSVMADCVSDYTVYVLDCSASYSCSVDIVNNGCQTLEVYAAQDGEWQIVTHVAVGATKEYHPVAGETLIFAYSYDDVLGTVTANCGKTYTINDDDCAEDCIMHLTNNACHDLKIYVQNGSDWTYIGLLIKGQTYDHHSANGVTYKFLYADGTVVGTWTGWCGESYTASDTCSSGCQIYLTNDACDVVKVFVEYNNDWALVGSLNQGVTYSHHSANGARYLFKYADGTTISTWTGWCGEAYTITDECDTSCDVFFDNDACEDILVYAETGNDWNYVGRLDKGVKYRHTAIQGVTYLFKYEDGTHVAQWDAWCGETYVIDDDCSGCNVYLKNSSCATLKVYKQNGYNWSYIGSLDQDRTYTHATENGTTYRFNYADGTTVTTWTGWCNESYEVIDNCDVLCHATIKNRTCGTVQILKNRDGVLVSKGHVAVGESKVLYDYEGTSYIIKNADGSHAGSWTSVCENIYTVHEECTTVCDGYIKNESCGPLTVYKAQSGYNPVSMGTVAVGSNLKVEAEEGTHLIMKYADGSVVGEWNLQCNVTHTVGDTCSTPCDGVTVTSIKIYDQETDEEIPGIGALTEGMVVDGDLLPAGYYITAETSSATESVTLIVDGWLVCENYAPYTYPNAAHQGTDWDGGAGAHTVTIKVSSEADCYGDVCDEVTINFTISEPTTPEPSCNLAINVAQSAPTCDGMITLSASATGESDCCQGGGGTPPTCGTLETYGGYVIDVDAVSGCADDAGIRLWGAGAEGETFVTVDLGNTIAAGNEVCFRMYMKHCLNTDSTSASASLYTSTTADGGFALLAGAIFDNAEFADFCFDLTADSRYVKIVDNGQCSFRIDAVTVTGTSGGADCASSEVHYYWINSVGDTIATSPSVAVTTTGDYMVAVKDCAGCLAVVEDVIVSQIDADDCSSFVFGGQISLANGETVADVCIGDGVSDAFTINLAEQTGEFSAWVVLDAFRNIIDITTSSTFDFETSTHGAGLCLICHVSYNGALTGFEVGLDADAVTGDVDFSNEVSITKFTSGGPCSGGLAVEGGLSESRSFEANSLTELSIYPNPVDHTLFINTIIGESKSVVNAQMFTVDGKLVKEALLMPNQLNQVDMSDLQSQQFYIVKLSNAEIGVHIERIYKSN